VGLDRTNVSTLYRAVIAFLLLKWANLIINVIRFPVLRPTDHPPPQTTSLLIPMRNEESRLRDTLPSIAAQFVDEVIVLDDCSTDCSMDLARAIAVLHPHVEVIRGSPTPAGWTGKTWACHQLAEQARGEQLIFCDIDVVLLPTATDSILAEKVRQQADVFSVFPRQITRTWAERALIPLIDDVLLCFLPFPLLHVESALTHTAATANGSIIALSRKVYTQTGGFSSVRAHVVEDVALARHIRRRGLNLGLALGGSVVQTRMYTSYGQIIAGFGRGLLPSVGGSRSLLAAGTLWHIVVYTLPLLLVARRRRWIVPLVLTIAERLVVDAKCGRFQPLSAATAALTPLAVLPVILQALRRRQVWRARAYPQ
jgi:cellulose synthase/poly-beta-1,6-N-acetylglucosamine synthase-like glycosyltransferase